MRAQRRGLSVEIMTALAAARTRGLILISTVALVIALTPTLVFADSNVRLMIDPGHGGTDPGAIGNGIAEKDINLQIGQKLVKAAQRQGWHVGMTRSRDTFVPLRARSAFSNRWEATALVSIHSNSMGPSARGNMTIHRGGSSGILSQDIMNRMQRLTPYTDIGSRQDVRGLAVLGTANAPAVIVEVLSVSSAPEAATLEDPEMQNKYAEAIVMGVADYHGLTYKAPKQPSAAPKPAAPKSAPAPALEAALKTAPGSMPQPASDPALKTEPKTAKPDVKPVPKPTTKTESVITRPVEDNNALDVSLRNEITQVKLRFGTGGADSLTRTGGADSLAPVRGLASSSNWLDGLIGRLVGQER